MECIQASDNISHNQQPYCKCSERHEIIHNLGNDFLAAFNQVFSGKR